MHKLFMYSGMLCKNTVTNIFVYGRKGVKDDDDDAQVTEEPFVQPLNQMEFSIRVKSPKKRSHGGSVMRPSPKKRTLMDSLCERENEPAEISSGIESLISMATSKQMQVNLITEALAVRRTGDSHQHLWNNVGQMNRVPSKGPENPHFFLKIVVRFFTTLKPLEEMEAVNLLRDSMATYMMENNTYLKVTCRAYTE